MKYLETYNQNILNEVLLYNKASIESEYEVYIICYKKYIYIVENTDEEINKFLSALKHDSFNPSWNSGEDLSEIVSELKEKLPDVIIFSVINSEIFYDVSGMYNYPIETTVSNQFIEILKTVKKELDIDTIHLHSNTFDSENDIETDDIFDIDTLIDKFTKDLKVRKMPKYVYHGTSTKSLSNIISSGLKVSSGSNWKSVYKSNEYLFFSSSIIDANVYARITAGKNQSFPIIFKIDTSGIDDSKIDFDYDFYITYVCDGNDYFDNLYNCSSRDGNIDDAKNKALIDLENKVVGATYRKFAYKGNIYPKFIKSLYYNNSFEEEINNETDDFETFSEMVDEVSDFSSWNEYQLYDDFDGFLEKMREMREED